MRDYNAIQFRSPSEKQKQTVSATRSSSLSPIPKTLKGSSSTLDDRATAAISYGNHSGLTSTTSTSQSSRSDIRLPFLPNHTDETIFGNTEQQHISSTSSPNKVANKVTNIPRFNQSSLSPIRTNTTAKVSSTYRSTSPVESVMSLSPIPAYNSKSINVTNQQQHPSTSTVSSVTSGPISNGNGSSNTMLSPSDALALRRDYNNNTDLYINKLREDIQHQQATIQKISSASSKSDAVILELRSTIRQYKRQLDKVQAQQQQSTTSDKGFGTTNEGNNTSLNSGNFTTNGSTIATDEQNNQQLDVTNHPMVVELSQQLHEAQSKLVTADLIRKELEDTIEAEQYTWELRVQDLEREVNELKAQLQRQQQSKAVGTEQAPTKLGRSVNTSTLETNTNESEPDEYRKQLQDAQNEIQRYRSIIMTTTTTSDTDDEINNNNNSNNNSEAANIAMWKEKVLLLEQERLELQGCLDEALKELEAVDLELQQEANTTTLREENIRLQQMIDQLQNSSTNNPMQQQRGLISPDDHMNNDNVAVREQLQHLYRWLLERDGTDVSTMIRKYQNSSVDEIIDIIQQHIENNSASINHLNELEQQISVYKGDIHAKDEEMNELRNNLKEAVSLLRPIQDTVTKLEKEKTKYQESFESVRTQYDTSLIEIRKYKQLMNDKDDEIDQMKQDIESLEIQLSKAKLTVANTVVAQHNLGSTPTTTRSLGLDPNNTNNDVSSSSPSDALDEKRAKHRSGENNLKEMLRDAQLRDTGTDTTEREQQLQTIQEYEHEIKLLRDELAQNDTTIQNLQNELQSAHEEVERLQEQVKTTNKNNDEPIKILLQQAELRLRTVEQELQETKLALASKRDAERSLNRSLKDALDLIKPLQKHLEESEIEKRQIEHELEILKKQQSGSRNVPNNNSDKLNISANSVSVEVVRDLETTVRQLEKENAMLHDALEDMSHTLNASHISESNQNSPNRHSNILSPNQQQQPGMTTETGRNLENNDSKQRQQQLLHQEYVELKSRYEVTQTRLKDAYNENHTLSELIQKEVEEKYVLNDEVTTLREQLQRKSTKG
jgi:hypothetical protein